MKKGMAMEGFIREDGTVRPSYKYDDTELRAKIQTNRDSIDNLGSRIKAIEDHGWNPDPTKADKVTTATAGDIALLTEEGNLSSNGKKLSDLSPATHSHDIEDVTGLTDALADKAAKNKIEGANAGHVQVADGEVDIDSPRGLHLHITDESGGSDVQHDVDINVTNVANLERALATPSSTPENDATKLITSKAVYDVVKDKLDKWSSKSIPFVAENGALALTGDEEEYDDIFNSFSSGSSGQKETIRVLVEDSLGDTWEFVAMYTTKISQSSGPGWNKKVLIYLGGYTIMLRRDPAVSSGATVLSYAKSLDTILSESVESQS